MSDRSRARRALGCLVFVLVLCAGGGAGGDEGFFRPDRPPLEALAARHDFRPPEGYFERIAAATLRIGDGGGCAVLVSADGLVATSQHLVRERIAELGARGSLLLEQGFLAPDRAREIPLPGLRLERLVASVDVGARIEEAVRERLAAVGGEDARAARARAIQDLLDAESTRSGLVCRLSDPEGAAGPAILQRFAVHRDLRLVFVPETAAAAFGGDLDNFHFPRYCLDLALLRIWEDGRPLAGVDHLSWSSRPVRAEDFVVLAGYPERMGRLVPPSVVRANLERIHPAVIRFYDAMIAALEAFAARGESEARRVAPELASLRNGRKAYAGRLEAMLQRGGLVRLEARWREDFADPESGDAEALRERVDALAAVLDRGERRRLRRLFSRLESRGLARARQILGYARALAELEEGDPRLDEQRAAILAEFEGDGELEAVVAGHRLELARGELGADDPFVSACDAVAGEAGLAAAFRASRIRDLAFRTRLVAAGPAAIAASDDPLMRLAAGLEPVWAELWGQAAKADDGTVATLEEEIAVLVSARRAPRFGPEPDGSLRVSFGRVRGFERAGSRVPAVSNLWGLYARHSAMAGRSGFELPRAFLAARSRLDLDLNVDFAITADAGQGSSGGPVLDREGRVVGLLFDINYENLGQYFVYGEAEGRGVAVAAAFAVAALREIYGAETLADELAGRRR